MQKLDRVLQQVLFKILGCNSSGPIAYDGFKPFKSYPFSSNSNVIHLRGWPIKLRSLIKPALSEYIGKLPIKFLCLIRFRFRQTTAISLFQGWDSLAIFPLTIRISIEVSRVCPGVTNQVIDIQIVLLFNLFTQFLKSSFQPTIASFLCFRMSLFLFRIILIPSVIQGIELTDLLVFDGMRLSAASWIKEVIRSKFLDRTRVRVTVEVFLISKIQSVLPHRVVVTFLIQVNLPLRFILGRDESVLVSLQQYHHHLVYLEIVCPGTDLGMEVIIRSSVFSSRVWKMNQVFQPMIIHNFN